jgi:hypothetical protein
MRRYPNPEAAGYGWWFCMASKDEKPSLLVLGNSHANALYAGLSGTEGFSQHSILSIGDCDPDDQEYESAVSNPHPCWGINKAHQQKFIDAIIANSDSLKYVILAGLTPAPDARYIAGIRRRIESVESHNAKVVVFVPHLELSFDIKYCFSRSLLRPTRNCDVDIQERAKLDKKFEPLIKELERTHPEVPIFDPNDLFCDAEKCSMVHDGIPLLRDRYQHLSVYGSVEQAKLFRKWATTHAPDILR